MVAESVEELGGVAKGRPLLRPGAGAFPVVDQFGVSLECLAELPASRMERHEPDGGDSVDEHGVDGGCEFDCCAVVLFGRIPRPDEYVDFGGDVVVVFTRGRGDTD